MKDIFRIVSLVPSLTESLCDLGLSTCIVGCTSYCISPKNLSKTAKIVGGTKDPNIEIILNLNPTHIITNSEENTSDCLATLTKLARLSSFQVIKTFPKTVQETVDLLEIFGTIFSIESESKKWTTAILNELKILNEIEKLHLNYLYFIWRKPWMVAGNQTYISHLLSLIGLTNLIQTSQNPKERYPEFIAHTSKDILAETQIFLFSSEPFPFKQRHVTEFFTQSQVKMHRYFLVNGQNLSWYGTRTLKALQYLASLKEQILNLERS